MSKVRCAIYTRKSSEEGLEQDFNSLHAQREACSAYILSQASEGWSLLPGEYDDGGLSGGTLERPALQRLLADINAGKIDIIVVYKVDRLTRSLLDFSKLVETMDKAGTSFVSVTQSFNTTTYVSRALQHEPETRSQCWRIPAKDLEGAVIARLAEALEDPLALTSKPALDINASVFSAALASARRLAEKVRKKYRLAIRDLVERVEVHAGELRIALDDHRLSKALGLADPSNDLSAPVLTSEVRLTRTGMAMRLVQPSGSGAVPREADRSMIDLLVKARHWWTRLSEGGLTITPTSPASRVSTPPG